MISCPRAGHLFCRHGCERTRAGPSRAYGGALRETSGYDLLRSLTRRLGSTEQEAGWRNERRSPRSYEEYDDGRCTRSSSVPTPLAGAVRHRQARDTLSMCHSKGVQSISRWFRSEALVAAKP